MPGFIALAAVIFGRWDPIRATLAALLFGFATNLQNVLGIIGSPVPSEFLLMLPYVVTIFAVAGLVGQSRGPPPPASRTSSHERRDRHDRRSTGTPCARPPRARWSNAYVPYSRVPGGRRGARRRRADHLGLQRRERVVRADAVRRVRRWSRRCR